MKNNDQWIIGIDRGGTFTDVVAKSPDGELVTFKLLSEDTSHYEDAAIFALHRLLKIPQNQIIPDQLIHSIRMGTTVATNALLERKGVPVCFVTTKGFRDILVIGYQSRPHLFELHIQKPSQLCKQVIEIDERIDHRGKVLVSPDPLIIEEQLKFVFEQGIYSLAIVLLNSYRNDCHEKLVGEIAQRIGFTQISLSSQTMQVQKIVSRGDTTTVDAYLNPILRKYVQQVRRYTGVIPLKFMKSSGGLVDADSFTAKDAIISGPAGGVIGYAHIAKMLGIDKLIGFDMGGTSTDVSRYDSGQCEKVYETETAGVRIQTPMINVITVAAGGGSILHFDGLKLTVGPDSAGAFPGPACYRNGGPLALTDANLLLGRIVPHYFPKVFGPNHDKTLDEETVRKKFKELSEEIFKATGIRKTAEEVAVGYIHIANENMVKPIKEISVAKGFNVQEYILACFGGAGAQHACAIARSLGIKRILLHPLAGVLSAYGMILADVVHEDTRAVLIPYELKKMSLLEPIFIKMEGKLRHRVMEEGVSEQKIKVIRYLDIRPVGTDTPETVIYQNYEDCYALFQQQYQQRYGFLPEAKLEIVNIRVEVIGEQSKPEEPEFPLNKKTLTEKDANEHRSVYFDDRWHSRTPIFKRAQLKPGYELSGPAIVIEENSTIVIEPGLKAVVNSRGHIILEQIKNSIHEQKISTKRDPIMLEIFNNLFMSIAEQMGRALQRTAHSVNIKERLDFSCAVFDPEGGLVANAPHIPVHLGAMGESVAYILQKNRDIMQPGDVFVTNDPFHGGSHLPDITVVTPVFNQQKILIFCVANRGHHADIGGITPGSMPPFSKNLDEEGVVIENFKLISEGKFDETGLRTLLLSGKYPARNIQERLSDLRAQVAANARGVQELHRLIQNYDLDVVQAYMQHVQKNAEHAMRKAIANLPDGVYTARDFLDDATELRVTITIDGDHAKIDFTGISPQIKTNLNAPPAVTRAAILYVFRTLIEENVPLNAGCFKPLEIIIPEGTVLNPSPGTAVAGGNVETSQRIVDVLFRALKKVAASQGTMNNFTFGQSGYGYYETIAGGSGAGPGFDGADAVHTHMTNTRITDPEVLEHRYPEVRLEEFSIRRGSGGKGHYQGGDGIIRKIKFLQPTTVSILSERRVYPPYGLNGAEDGKCGQNILIRSNGKIENLGGKLKLRVNEADVLSIKTPGGGGYHLTSKQLSRWSPVEMRRLIRLERWDKPTSGLCADYAQMNLLIILEKYAADFEQFCRLNPKPCPLLEVLAPGDPFSHWVAPGADIRTDLPRYRIHKNETAEKEVLNIKEYWSENLVAFLLGCSFTFESALLKVEIPVRHIELNRNVPMYITNIDCQPSGPFKGKMVVSMRPMTREQAEYAFKITAEYSVVHGEPLCHIENDFNTIITDPEELGIRDINHPDYGEAIPIRSNEVTVFWACGVTSQLAAIGADIEHFISHSPGHMFISDKKNEELRIVSFYE
ncbi:MAG: putative hydro-lyase [Candidatus Dadabacteria bacterium]|nr:putative hydro-lyase [Candidatus Dadabacteria bacterium]NIQ16572.1 putative hydro-lyase [Candidatus Dadabacteria bacterium]